MSWSINNMTNIPAGEVADKLAEQTNVPAAIGDYIEAGVDALMRAHGDDVIVSVTGSGHLCDGKSGDDTTSATIQVKRGA
jgi:hypothetical protein